MKLQSIRRAISMKYNLNDEFAPNAISAGKNSMADKIIQSAIENDIPIYRNPRIMKNLFKFELIEELPEEVFSVVAETLAFVNNVDNLANDEDFEELGVQVA